MRKVLFHWLDYLAGYIEHIIRTAYYVSRDAMVYPFAVRALRTNSVSRLPLSYLKALMRFKKSLPPETAEDQLILMARIDFLLKKKPDVYH